MGDVRPVPRSGVTGRRLTLALITVVATTAALVLAPGGDPPARAAGAAPDVAAPAVAPAAAPAAAPALLPERPPKRRNHHVQRTCGTSPRRFFVTCNAIRQTDQDPPVLVPVATAPGGGPATIPTDTTGPGVLPTTSAAPGSTTTDPSTGSPTLTPNAASGATATPATTSVVVPAGYGPAELRSAYALPSTGGSGATVAIVDAYDDPTAESDLSFYRSTYGLPACTTANGCFAKVNENGAASPLPAADSGWAGEISLDLDAVSAACPNCRILLVEASSASISDLGTGVNTAVAKGAKFVSNSYGGPETGNEPYFDRAYYSHPGVVITASSGDAGYGVQYPASGAAVTAVGGTTLSPATGTARGWTETAWSGAGSGCSVSEVRPTAQAALTTGCTKRAVADVSAVADPQTGLAVYQTTGASGWQVYGGTSLSSPIIAGISALAGTPGATDTPNTYPYARSSALNDVTSGSNGTCTPTVLCTAGVGYDGPTGLGTPRGTAALGPASILPLPTTTTAPPTTTTKPPVTTTTTPPVVDPIAVKYLALGGAASYLGTAVGSPYAVGTGRAQNYTAGTIYYSAATGAWAVHGAIISDYLAQGGPTGPLGFPTSDETGTADGVGRFNNFAGAPGLGVGSVYWTPSTGAHTVRGLIRAKWASLGYERGRLGYPTVDEYGVTGGRRSVFAGGAIVYYTANGSFAVTYR